MRRRGRGRRTAAAATVNPANEETTMLRVITANLNGIRSAAKKGFFDWFGKQNADIVCVQELKCSQDDMTPEFLAPHGFTGYFQHAQKKGYSGAGLYTRHEPDEFIAGFGSKAFDHEGRYVELRYGNLSLVSVYVPSGSSGDERQAVKYRFMGDFYAHLDALRREREVIFCGDINIVHNSGCLPQERAWLSKVFDELGYVDVFRMLDPRPEQYTWWSNRGQAYAKNVGWRIDYQIATPGIALTAKHAS
ncbi:hypothetical protein DFQ30_004092, partial [Apophysomyces sp. BC1015]